MFTTKNIDFTANKLKLPKASHILKYLEERTAINEHYDFIDCSITSSGLICQGVFSSAKLTKDYHVLIEFKLPQAPRVFVINPKIEFNSKIHMYKDNSLCLYYPPDNSYTFKQQIYETIIPWTSEWLIFYELYKFKGAWLGKYKLH